jgi:hypothetical protein
VSKYQIRTVESRRFDITGAVFPIEVEFHKEPRWAAELEEISIASREPLVDGLALARYSARVALTGSALPALTIMSAPGEPTPLTTPDLLDLAFLVAAFGRVPTEEDYSEGSRYLAFRAAIERRLELKHIHLAVRGGERQIELENAVEEIALRLAEHSLAFSKSPEIGFARFIDVISKNSKIFSFRQGTDILLGATALGSAYQLAIMSSPVVAVQLAAGGASAYLVLKFGRAVGNKVEQLIQNW